MGLRASGAGGCMDGRTDGGIFSPFYRTLSPTAAAAKRAFFEIILALSAAAMIIFDDRYSRLRLLAMVRLNNLQEVYRIAVKKC